MFKRLISSASSTVSGKGDAQHSKKAWESSNSSSSQSSELVSRSEIPTLLRRSKSSQFPTAANFAADDEHNSTEISVDPFEPTTLKRSRSLQFLGRRNSMSSLRKVVKSVRFEKDLHEPVEVAGEQREEIEEPGEPLSGPSPVGIKLATLFEDPDIHAKPLFQADILEPGKENLVKEEYVEPVPSANPNVVLSLVEHDYEQELEVGNISETRGFTGDLLNELSLEGIVSSPSTGYMPEPSAMESEVDNEDSESESASDTDSVVYKQPPDAFKPPTFLTLGSRTSLQFRSLNTQLEPESPVFPAETDNGTGDEFSEGSSLRGLVDFGTKMPVLESKDTTMSPSTGLSEEQMSRKKHIGQLLSGILEDCGTSKLEIGTGGVVEALECISKHIRAANKSLQEKEEAAQKLEEVLLDYQTNNEALCQAKQENLHLSATNQELLKSNSDITAESSKNEFELQKLLFQNNHLVNRVHELESNALLKSLEDERASQTLIQIRKVVGQLPEEQRDGNKGVDLVNCISRIFKEKEEYELDIADLSHDKEDLVERVESFEIIVEDLDAQLHKSKSARHELELINNMNEASFKLEREGTEEQFQSLRDEIRELHETVKRYQQSETQLGNDLFDTTCQMSALENEVKGLDASKRELQETNLQLQKQIESLKQQNTEFTKATEVYQSQLHASHSKIDHLEVQCKSLRSEIEDLDATKNLLKEDLNTKEMSLRDLGEELSSKIELVCALTEKNEQFHSTIRKLNEDKFEIISNNNYYITKYNECRDFMKQVSLQLEENESANDHMISQFEALKLSHSLSIKFYNELLNGCEKSLRPMMYKESISYFHGILKALKSIEIFGENHNTLLNETNKFVVTAVSDLVTNFLNNESILERELANKQANYNKMLNELSDLMVRKLNTSGSAFTPSCSPTKPLTSYINGTYR